MLKIYSKSIFFKEEGDHLINNLISESETASSIDVGWKRYQSKKNFSLLSKDNDKIVLRSINRFPLEMPVAVKIQFSNQKANITYYYEKPALSINLLVLMGFLVGFLVVGYREDFHSQRTIALLSISIFFLLFCFYQIYLIIQVTKRLNTLLKE